MSLSSGQLDRAILIVIPTLPSCDVIVNALDLLLKILMIFTPVIFYLQKKKDDTVPLCQLPGFGLHSLLSHIQVFWPCRVWGLLEGKGTLIPSPLPLINCLQVGQASLMYILTQLAKMLFLATFFPMSELEEEEGGHKFDFFNDFLRVICIEVLCV